MTMGKQYLKMSDVFRNEMRVVGDSNNMIADNVGIIIGCYSGDMMAEYVLHAINSHDELVAENERLRTALEYATNHSPDTAKKVPDGWQFAPKVPTREMIEQGNAAMAYDCCSGDASDAYQAMLASAPKLRD